MQVMKICGVKKSSFTPPNSTEEINGLNVYVIYEQDGVEGMACERLYVKEKVLEACGNLIPGMDITVSYNRWGKIEYVQVIKATK